MTLFPPFLLHIDSIFSPSFRKLAFVYSVHRLTFQRVLF